MVPSGISCIVHFYTKHTHIIQWLVCLIYFFFFFGFWVFIWSGDSSNRQPQAFCVCCNLIDLRMSLFRVTLPQCLQIWIFLRRYTGKEVMRTTEFCNFNFNLFGYRRCSIGSPSGLLWHAGWSLLFYAPFPLESHSVFFTYMLISQGNTLSDLSDFISNSIIFLFHCI